jgi:hypothetical protein
MSEEKKPKEDGRTVNTGGGAYVEGGVEVSGGDFVGRDKTVTYNYGTSSADLVQLFEAIYQQIEERPKDPDVDKAEIVAEVKRIEEEAAKGEEANPKKVARWLGTLAQMAPDIFEVVVACLTNPAAGVATVISKIAKKAQEEAA